MKVSKIGSLCKSKKAIATMSDPNGMWIGNGDCIYLLPEFATLEQSGIALALGISEKERDKIRFFQIDQATFNTRDLDEAETPCLPIDFLFNVGTDTVRPYQTQEGVLFLNTAHLAPLKEERENLTIFLRHLKNGKPYFAAKIGMELYAVFAPVDVINKNFMEKLDNFISLCEISFENIQQTNIEATEQMQFEDGSNGV